MSAPAPSSGGVERIVAIVLGTMIAVLVWVWIDLRKTARSEVMALDFTNPLLSAEPGECIEVEDHANPGFGHRVVVLAPAEEASRGRGAAVLRPREGPAKVAGYVQKGDPDLRTTAPYLVCEVRSAAPAPPGSPAGNREVLLFDLNSFGFARGAAPYVVLREVRPALVTWEGKPQRCHQVTVSRHDRSEGNWQLYLTRDARALGTVLRKYFTEASATPIQQTFHPCR